MAACLVGQIITTRWPLRFVVAAVSISLESQITNEAVNAQYTSAVNYRANPNLPVTDLNKGQHRGGTHFLTLRHPWFAANASKDNLALDMTSQMNFSNHCFKTLKPIDDQ
jgi:hypothetical protein